MSRITNVYLFTNRNVVVFNSEGEQVAALQASFGWLPKPKGVETKALKRILDDAPNIYLAKWEKWRHEITPFEFASLLGHGQWYHEEFEEV